MDCKKADEAILAYMDKTIKPAAAKSLALHLLNCESCREYFTALDMTMDELDAGEVIFTAAPEGFTEAVMSKVNELPAYKAKKSVNKGFVLQLTGGLCAVFAGVMLMITSGTVSLPVFDGILTSVRGWAGGIVSRIAQDGVPFFTMAETSFPNLGIFALLFAIVTMTLLITLQRGENVKA